ncbi:hypothetical protein GXW82_26885 [Streptacidiphilus sp. 4-A2]|nr:hypothetical protein [Streptacidiphilus sp. 4-A2]
MLPEAVDGWESVAVLGRRLGLDQAALNAAFTETRARMAGPGIELEVPAGYAELLAGLRSQGFGWCLPPTAPGRGSIPCSSGLRCCRWWTR